MMPSKAESPRRTAGKEMGVLPRNGGETVVWTLEFVKVICVELHRRWAFWSYFRLDDSGPIGHGKPGTLAAVDSLDRPDGSC
jgi:hypothetical protein